MPLLQIPWMQKGSYVTLDACEVSDAGPQFIQ